MKLLIVLVLLGLLALGLRLAIPHLGNSVAGGIVDRDGQPMLADCPDTPNCHRDEFVVTAEASQAISTLADIVSQQKGAQIVSQDERYLHATFTSRLMGFVDDVEFLLDTGDADRQSDEQGFWFAVPRALAKAIWEPTQNVWKCYAAL